MEYDKIDILKNTDIFSGFRNDELDIIACYSNYRELKKDEILFKAGDPSDTLYVLAEGEVSILKYADNGSEMEIARFMKNHCFGELNFLTGTPRNAEARMETDVKLLCFPKNGISFEEILKSHPAVAGRILHHLLVMIAGRLRQANTLIKENSPVIQELKKQVYIDKQTGLYNKTFMEEKLAALIQECSTCLSFVSIKPDNFKKINDAFGHEAGDEAIRIFAERMKKIVHDEELLSRYLGNEMIVLLPGYNRDGGMKYAMGIKEKLADLSFDEITKGMPFDFTVSMGISIYPEHSININELIDKARELPLLARGKGGNLILFPDDINKE